MTPVGSFGKRNAEFNTLFKYVNIRFGQKEGAKWQTIGSDFKDIKEEV